MSAISTMYGSSVSTHLEDVVVVQRSDDGSFTPQHLNLEFVFHLLLDVLDGENAVGAAIQMAGFVDLRMPSHTQLGPEHVTLLEWYCGGEQSAQTSVSGVKTRC